MDEEQFYNNIQKAFENLPTNFNILEEKIDIETQIAYFDYSEKIRKRNISEKCFKNKDELFLAETTIEHKKKILSAIAGLDDVQAYRTIEKFVEIAEPEIRQWAVLAMQESRMLLQSSLLDEQQVFISTGLGGKDKKLRYFVVFINAYNEKLNKTQRKLVKDELIFKLKHSKGIFESMKFMVGFTAAVVMLPLHANIKNVFRSVIDECNQIGNFLHEDLIITNVKELSRKEIIELIKDHEAHNFEKSED